MSRSSRNELGTYEDSYTPRLLRLVCFIAGLLFTAGMGFLLWRSPGAHGGYDTTNTVAMLGLLALFLVILWRFGRARVDLYSGGLVVHNFFRDYVITWAEVFALTYSPDDAWAYVELTSQRRLTLLAVARSEGESSARFMIQCAASLRAYERNLER